MLVGTSSRIGVGLVDGDSVVVLVEFNAPVGVLVGFSVGGHVGLVVGICVGARVGVVVGKIVGN